MSVREVLKKLLGSGTVRKIKMTRTVIEHDSSGCDTSCAICKQVMEELAEFKWPDWARRKP